MSEHLGSRIRQAREQLVARRGEIHALHAAGATGTQVVAALTSLVDDLVARLTAAAVEELPAGGVATFESGIALVAIGGYGRAELAPFSDVDFMFLYEPAARPVAETLCGRLVRDYWDAGLALGSSMRTLAECISLARKDTSIHTALIEARHVVGNPWLTGELTDRISRLTRGRRGARFVAAALAGRAAEQGNAGPSAHLLEPDIKKSKGGLRDLHLLRWVALARYAVAGIDRLEREGLLSPSDATVLTAAREFLLRLRNDQHFHAGRAQDTLNWDEQLRLAAIAGFQDRPGMRAVEQFMQQYYRHAAAVDDVTDRFVRRARDRSLWRRLVTQISAQRLGRDFRISGGELTATPEALPGILASLERTVHLFTVASRNRVAVADAVRERVRESVPQLNGQDPGPARRELLALLAEPGHLAPTLRHLHALGILEKLIPEFAHSRGLIQFNQYHKYTVDEHTLHCVANAEKLLGDRGPLGQVYRDIGQKEVLHLALVLHDLGKGFEDDHSELGREIALRTAERFELDPHRRDLLVFLVHQHLFMAHLAFRRDTSDQQLLAKFARQVGTPQALKMLFVLTAADIASVGPDTWTSWKAEVLADLFSRAMEKVNVQAPVLDAHARTRTLREQVASRLRGAVPADWLERHLDSLAPSYALTTPVDRIAEHLRVIRTLPAGDAIASANYDATTETTAYTVYTFDSITPGLFSKISGVLAAKGLQILSAQIATFKDGVVVDRFEVLDPDFAGEPARVRLADVTATIRRVLCGEQSVEDLFTSSPRVGPRFDPRPGAMHEPTQVKIDNDASDGFTIIDVFTNDRQGLLYVITRTIFELGLSVSVAKIATSLDQVLDVFYVTDRAGQKVTDSARLEEIHARLVQSIEAFESNGVCTAVSS